MLGKRRFEVVVEDCEIQGARTDGVAREAMAGWEGAWENGDQKGRDFVVLWDGGAGAVMCTPRVRFNGEVWAGDEVDD